MLALQGFFWRDRHLACPTKDPYCDNSIHSDQADVGELDAWVVLWEVRDAEGDRVWAGVFEVDLAHHADDFFLILRAWAVDVSIFLQLALQGLIVDLERQLPAFVPSGFAMPGGSDFDTEAAGREEVDSPLQAQAWVFPGDRRAVAGVFDPAWAAGDGLQGGEHQGVVGLFEKRIIDEHGVVKIDAQDRDIFIRRSRGERDGQQVVG